LSSKARTASEMVRLLEAVYQIDPLDLNVGAFLGHAYLYAGREAQALKHWKRSVHLLPYRTNQHLAEYHLGRAELDQAAAAIQQMKQLKPNDPWTYTYEGYLAALRGDEETARHLIGKLDELTNPGLNCMSAPRYGWRIAAPACRTRQVHTEESLAAPPYDQIRMICMRPNAPTALAAGRKYSAGSRVGCRSCSRRVISARS
jgi:tetratricopeptide (TPR) repeat protein